MSYSVFIPARHASTRLPGKPLLELAGKPLIRHVYERARESGASRIVIATDDPRIAAAAEAFGAESCMTSTRHVSGTDRIAEAVGLLGYDEDRVIVNLQGDEAQMPGAAIRQVGDLLSGDARADLATLYRPLSTRGEFHDPNVVKLVFDADGYALYFSRSPIPWQDGRAGAPAAFRHVGLYAYRVGFLKRFSAAAPSPAERCERLEQLRALHFGARIRVAEALCEIPPGIDTPADLERVRRSGI